jgi:subtilase family serine protease
MARTSMVCFPKCVAIVLLLSAASFAQTFARDRVRGPVDDSQMSIVAGNVHGFAKPEFDQGRADGNMKINRAAIVFKPSTAQQSALEALLASQQNRTSSNYHKWLTPEQYADRFGMTRSDLAKVSTWLQSKGLTVDETARGRNRVFFTGTVAQIEDTFRTEIHRYVLDSESHFANATELSVPAAFADTVLSFGNLNDFHPKPRLRVAKPHFTSSISGNHFVAPADFATIYGLSGLNKLYSSGLDGTGETIAVVGDSAINLSDIDAFRSASNLPKNEPQTIVVSGTGTPTHNGDEVEADLDLEWSGAVAKGANIIYVLVGPNANGGAFDALTFAIDNKVAPVISNSFGLCEADMGTANAQATQVSVQQAIAQGQTITSPTGDAGAADCDGDLPTTPAVATLGLAVDTPASIPEITGVGGSEFMGDAEGGVPPVNTQYWNAGNDAGGGSATGYIPEMVWNDTAASVKAGQGIAAGGGGASTIFGKPTWQTGTGVPNDNARDVPDISLNASNFHDPYLICSQAFFTSNNSTTTSCTNGFRASDNSLAAVGGTSAGAPTFAGILAIINQATRAAKPSGQGNVNPELYSLAKTTPTAFHDITTGTNSVPCSPGTPSTAPVALRCPSSGQFASYNAGVGYDQATGLGSIDANNLVRAWPNFSSTPDFAVGGTAVNVSAPGQSGASTVTVTAMNAFGGTVNLSFTPCSAMAEITCSLSASSVSVNNSGATATLSVSTIAPSALAKASPQVGSGAGWFASGGGALLAGFFVMGAPSRRRSGLLGILFLTLVAAGISCGGGSSSHTSNPGTPAGTYTIAVTATSGSLTHTTNVAITVQ